MSRPGETVALGGLLEAKRASRNGVQVGIVAGYLSTWGPDSGGVLGVPDQFVKGAWTQSLEDHRRRGNRQVRLKDNHGRVIGGFPIEAVREDEHGLYGVGEVSLETQEGREVFALVRQGILTDFSVGYSAIQDRIDPKRGVRLIEKAHLWEASIVDEPANPEARILEVKRAWLSPRPRIHSLSSILGDLRACSASLRAVPATPSGREAMRFEGLAATGDVDSERVRFAPGCWAEPLAELRRRGIEELPLLYDHERLLAVGRVPLSQVRETERGLEVACEVFGETKLQRELGGELRRGELRYLSVGYLVRQQRHELDERDPWHSSSVRVVDRAELREVSLVPAPRNWSARVLRVAGA
jgi:HK97 family phage prohead protease